MTFSDWMDSVRRQLVEECGSDVIAGIRFEVRNAGRHLESRQYANCRATEALATFAASLSVQTQAKITDIGVCTRDAELSLDPVPWYRDSTFFSNIHRGILGYEFSQVGDQRRVDVYPQEVIATNRTPRKWVERIARDVLNCSVDSIRVRTFRSRQWTFRCPTRISDFVGNWRLPSDGMFRGSPLVPLSAVSPENLLELRNHLALYLTRSIQPDGRARYLYYPSRCEEDRSKDNSIRQWMATFALVRFFQIQPTSVLAETISKNVNYNLHTMFREEQGQGLIFDGTSVKLGAVSMAWMALSEWSRSSPQHDNSWLRAQCDLLMRTIDQLWSPNGEFRTFERPRDRNDQWNFYPGEALCAWSERYRHTLDGELLERFMRSFRLYRDWHRENRNPAFIPWHTQAYATIWRITQDSDLIDFIFEMNDWLIPLQQWENAPHPDCCGRFFHPSGCYGPPHASSTGVYLEGLCDAFELATLVQDKVRATRYRETILRGLRSVLQLTYKNETDMVFIGRHNDVLGGVRTCEYDNTIRIDNVQHNLLAVLKLQRLSVFEEVSHVLTPVVVQDAIAPTGVLPQATTCESPASHAVGISTSSISPKSELPSDAPMGVPGRLEAVDVPPSRCVILVPFQGRIVSKCQSGLCELERRGYVVRRVEGYSAIDQARNQMGSDALRDGFDETFWIDSDVGFDPDDVDRVRSLGLPITCGIYPKKGRRELAIHIMPGTEQFRFGKSGGLVELLYAGTGFLHVRRMVYESILEQLHLPVCNEHSQRPLWPFFMPLTRPWKGGSWYLAEDFAFCHRARLCGHPIIADTRIRLWHVGEYAYGWEDAGIDRERYTDFNFRFNK